MPATEKPVINNKVGFTVAGKKKKVALPGPAKAKVPAQ